jgi:DNA-binding NtrC family response regulator
LRSHAVAVPARTPARAGQTPPNLEALAGNNPRYARALRMARQGLLNELPVLLLGETGTGKEVSPAPCTRPARAATSPSSRSTARPSPRA